MKHHEPDMTGYEYWPYRDVLVAARKQQLERTYQNIGIIQDECLHRYPVEQRDARFAYLLYSAYGYYEDDLDAWLERLAGDQRLVYSLMWQWRLRQVDDWFAGLVDRFARFIRIGQ